MGQCQKLGGKIFFRRELISHSSPRFVCPAKKNSEGVIFVEAGQLLINAMFAGVGLCLIGLVYELINGSRLGDKDN